MGHPLEGAVLRFVCGDPLFGLSDTLRPLSCYHHFIELGVGGEPSRAAGRSKDARRYLDIFPRVLLCHRAHVYGGSARDPRLERRVRGERGCLRESIVEDVRRVSGVTFVRLVNNRVIGPAFFVDLFSGAVGSVSIALAVLISSFYLCLSRDGVERFIRAVFPLDYEKQALKIYENSKRKIGHWFRTQIILSIIMGFSVWGAMAALGVKHAFLLGVVAGIFEIVPFVGPILSGAIAVLVALSTSVPLGIYALIVFLILQQLESNILVPLLMKRSVGLHPVIVIISLFIGGEVGGILGILIAVPAAAVVQEMVEEWSSRKRPASAAF